jgi:hypothetical protein
MQQQCLQLHVIGFILNRIIWCDLYIVLRTLFHQFNIIYFTVCDMAAIKRMPSLDSTQLLPDLTFNHSATVPCINGYYVKGSLQTNVSQTVTCPASGNLDVMPVECVPKGKHVSLSNISQISCTYCLLHTGIRSMCYIFLQV